MSKDDICELWRHDMAAYATLRNNRERISYLLNKKRLSMNELTIYDLILIGHLVNLGKIRDVDII